MKVKNFNYLMDIRVISRSSGTHQGAQAFKYLTVVLLGLLTSQKKGTWRGRFTLSKFALFACAILLSGFLFSHSAYATTPYLNVSSGAPDGLISFSKVQPSSAGTVATASDTLTINTNCSVGYNVYVSAINGGDTNLTNDAAAGSGNNVITTSSATVGGSSAVLSANTWGVNGSESDVSAGKYYGLPTYANATNNPLVTKASVATSSTVPIYYGAKVTTAIAPGTYNGDVLYTVLPNTACTYYTIAFNANGGTGTMDNQDITVGEATNLSANTFMRSGYTFIGWSNSANGKTGTAVNGIGTAEDVDYSDIEKVTDIADFNTTKTLYAIWALVSGDMQTWTGCASLASNAIVYLNDSRDNTVYAVKKLPDGKCWMIENLTISATGLQVSRFDNANTNIPNTDSNYYYLPPQNASYETASSINNSNVLSASTSVNFSSSGDYSRYPQVGYRAAGTTDNDTGNAVPEDTAYYNFYTATLGFSYYKDGKTAGTSPRDICPKGWRLPWTSDSGNTRQGNAEFYTLALAYNNDSSVWTDYIAPGSTGSGDPSTSNATVRNNMISGDATSIDRFGNNGAAGFTYAGFYSGSTLSYVGRRGYYWSSSVSNESYGYNLYFNITNVYTQYPYGKYYGYSVRCVDQNNYTINYNANGASGTPSKTTEGTQAEGNYITTATVGSMTKTGYHFAGWSRNSGDNNTVHHNANTSTLVKDIATAASASDGGTITLYAVWQKNTYTLTVNNGNTTAISGITITDNTAGSTISSGTSVEWGHSITVVCTPKSGYKCTGWTSSNTSLVANSSNASYTFTMPQGAITLTGNGAANTYTYTLSYSGVDFATSNKPSTQTWTGSATSHTFTIRSGTPGSYTPLVFSNYTYGGNTYSPGGTITLSSSSPSVTLTANWTRSCAISSSTGCKLADNKTWIYGNSGNAITWTNSFTGATNVDGHNAVSKSGLCPSDYSAPAITVFDSLLQAYGGTSYSYYRTGYREYNGALYRALGLSSDRRFWSSTENNSSNAYTLNVFSNSYTNSSIYNSKSDTSYVLCYK